MQGRWKFKSEGKHTIPSLNIKDLSNKDLSQLQAEKIINSGFRGLLEPIEKPVVIKKKAKK
jgi:hypothetical protein